jgi:hypothetical protein
MFYEDRAVLLESLAKVAAFEPSTIYLSHGTVTDGESLQSFINANG